MDRQRDRQNKTEYLRWPLIASKGIKLKTFITITVTFNFCYQVLGLKSEDNECCSTNQFSPLIICENKIDVFFS